MQKPNLKITVSSPHQSDPALCPKTFVATPLCNEELLPSCSGPATTLEEITSVGYAKAFPTTFAESSTSNSLLTQAMDVARGGKFTTIPASYPSTAWYTYTDSTCNYDCQEIYLGL